MITPEEEMILDLRRVGIIDKEREEEFLKNYGRKPGDFGTRQER